MKPRRKSIQNFAARFCLGLFCVTAALCSDVVFDWNAKADAIGDQYRSGSDASAIMALLNVAMFRGAR